MSISWVSVVGSCFALSNYDSQHMKDSSWSQEVEGVLLKFVLWFQLLTPNVRKIVVIFKKLGMAQYRSVVHSFLFPILDQKSQNDLEKVKIGT